MSAPLKVKRAVAGLKELRALTGDENGAQWVACTPGWTKARVVAFQTRAGAGGNSHRRPGQHVVHVARRIGGHMDFVPNDGWLEGCLNVGAAYRAG